MTRIYNATKCYPRKEERESDGGQGSPKQSSLTKEFISKKNKHSLWELLKATQQRIIAHKLRLHKQSNKILRLIYGAETSCSVLPRTAVSAQNSNHVTISENQQSIPSKRGQR